MANEYKTGLHALEDLLSRPLRLGDLSKIPGPMPRIGVTQMWKEALDREYTTMYFDFEMEPEFGPEDIDPDLKAPDDPITP